jgi:hypothetical protein
MAVIALSAAAQTAPSQDNGAAPAQGSVQAAAPQQSVSILKPKAGEKLRDNFLTITYALNNPTASASGTPNFQLRLDAQDPVTTTSTEYSFSGLTPGSHSVTVQLVDANGTPVQGGQATVQFTVLRQTSHLHGPQAIAVALRLDPGKDIRVAPPQQTQQSPENQPHQGSALPLLSVIGFGVLLGGIASAMKTREVE